MILVLIDTWWNVNHCNLPDMLSGMLVLIDTWWNVNFATFSGLQSFLSF